MKYIKKHKKLVIFAGIAVLILILNILAWKSKRFCDVYIAYIFPIWINTYGRFSGFFPFSVGEWLLVLGMILVILTAVITPSSIIYEMIYRCKRRKSGMEGMRGKTKEKDTSGKFRFFYIKYNQILAWIVLLVCFIMTLNCFILYHASTFSERYFDGEAAEYELGDVMRLRNEVVEKCNALSKEIIRNEEGKILYPGSTLSDGTMSDMQEKAVEAMRNLGKGISLGEPAEKHREYPQLDGFYPRPKALFFSDFMCQQYMQGYYFPFSMEANYNDVMYVMNKPFTMCHELAHLRGYIFEDEANFIGYLACTQSDDIYFQYSGYLCAFSYLENDLYKAKKNAPNAFETAFNEVGLTAVESIVYEDNIFVEQKEWDRINAKAILSTETVDKAADVFIDTNLKMNGVEDGALSYSRLVNLLMLYSREQ